jgi:hypothetical protein
MPDGKPNIVVIWGDDIGITNLSCYSDGLMGYRTPNIDRVANEGMRFTDAYGEQRSRSSCGSTSPTCISGPTPSRKVSVRPDGGSRRTTTRTDPFERADTTSNTYWDWYISKAYLILAAQAIVGDFLATFRDFPPRQKAASFTIDQALEKMREAASGAHD